MLEKLSGLEKRYEELSLLISDPEIINDQPVWLKHMKAHAELDDIIHTYREYKIVVDDLAEAETIIAEESDQEFKSMALEEKAKLVPKRDQLEAALKVLLLPKDPKDDKNVIMEIRAGTGGDEAALFAADLYKMYTRFAEKQGWRTEIMDSNYNDIGGIKEIVYLIEGKGAYSRLKYESGVHRVQRVPDTEGSGRVHTSAATVAVLPEAEDVEIDLNQNDIRVDVFCSSGPGGQSVNTTQSAVRITHIPTGTVVSCQDEKSQIKNKDKAMKVLRARIYEKMEQEKLGAMSEARKSMVGTGDRSERIRTYNFPQGRVSDHRIGLTLHKLDFILEGNLEEIIDALNTNEQAEKLKAVD